MTHRTTDEQNDFLNLVYATRAAGLARVADLREDAAACRAVAASTGDDSWITIAERQERAANEEAAVIAQAITHCTQASCA